MSRNLGNSKWMVVASSVHRWDDTRILYRQAVSLSALEYSQELTDVEYFKATATFRYMFYEFENSK